MAYDPKSRRPSPVVPDVEHAQVDALLNHDTIDLTTHEEVVTPSPPVQPMPPATHLDTAATLSQPGAKMIVVAGVAAATVAAIVLFKRRR